MKDKVCVVTGANGALGKAVCRGLARAGATTVMVCRDQLRGDAARREIISDTGNQLVQLMLADLSLLSSDRQLVEQVKSRYAKVDVLINNAAMYTRTRTVTAEGFETMFATNYLSSFLLTNLLLDLVFASRAARILNITAPSTTHLDFEDLQGGEHFRSFSAFGASKMGNLLFTFELARRLKDRGVDVNAVHPGPLQPELMREAPMLIRLFSRLVSTDPARAAEAIVWLASAPEVAGKTGCFFHKGKEIRASEYAYDSDVERRLWDISAELTGLRT